MQIETLTTYQLQRLAWVRRDRIATHAVVVCLAVSIICVLALFVI
jgi:hypothetical protein